MKNRVDFVRFMLALCIACLHEAQAENWPTWHGVQGNGVLRESDLPINWNRDTNVKWKVVLPEPCNSTPIIWDDKVFVTQPMNRGSRRTVICFDRMTGRKQWQSGIDADEKEPTHETNPYCSPSPVTDGERVICWFGSSGLVAFDMEGRHIWRRPLGKVEHVFGYGQSPVIHGDLCFLSFGPGKREFAVAVNKRTGEIVWQQEAPRPRGIPENGNDIYGMWSTPIVVDGVIVFCFRDAVVGFDPETGEQVWTCHGLGPQMKASPVANEGVVVALGGKDSSSLAMRTGGNGDVTNSHVLWRVDRARSLMGTGVICQGYLYANRRNGVIECIELKTGKVFWEKRHSGPSRNSNTWSSLTLVGDKIYAINQGTDVYILDASPTYRLVATNTLGEHTNSSISASQGNLFIRTYDSLWCIGE